MNDTMRRLGPLEQVALHAQRLVPLKGIESLPQTQLTTYIDREKNAIFMQLLPAAPGSAAVTTFEQYVLWRFRSMLHMSLIPVRASARSKILAQLLLDSIEEDFGARPQRRETCKCPGPVEHTRCGGMRP